MRRIVILMGVLCLGILAGGCGEERRVDPVAVRVHGDATRALGLTRTERIRVLLPGADVKTMLGGSDETVAADVPVRFRIAVSPEGGDGHLTREELQTDRGGLAETVFHAGTVPGRYVVEAVAVGHPDLPPARITVLAGITLRQAGREPEDGVEDGRIGTTLPEPLVLYAEAAPGVPMPGVTVTFESLAGLSVVDAAGQTDASGRARAFLRLGRRQGINQAAVRIRSAPWYEPGLDAPLLTAQTYALDWWSLAIGVFGGLAIFIFGMRLMSEGLSLAAGASLRRILNVLTRNRFLGVTAGVIVTGLIQSSSACSVMVIGFVNAGLMQLKQAIAVILGANVGTTVTAQMLSFKISGLALPAVIVGMVILLMARRQQTRFIAQIFIGFGLLFYGMSIMGAPLSSLRHSQTIIGFFDGLSCAPGADGRIPFGSLLQAVLAGTVMTLIVQSSTAAIGLLLAMAAAGLIDVYTGVAVLLGDNIGTTITAVLASIGSSRTARRTACAHVMFNVFGVLLMLGLFYIPWDGQPLFLTLIDRVTPGNAFAGENLTRYLANAHTGFNVVSTMVLIWCIAPLAYVCRILVPGEDEDEEPFRLLDPRLLASPSIALSQAWSEMGVMLRTSRTAHEQSFQALLEFSGKHWEEVNESVRRHEKRVDEFQTAITQYVTSLSQETLTEEQGATLPHLLHAVNDAERIGDYSMQLLRLARRRRKQDLVFSEEAVAELRGIYEEVEALFAESLSILGDETATVLHNREAAEAMLETIRTQNKGIKKRIKGLRKAHDARNAEGQCTIPSGVIYIDTLTNLERVAAHLVNILQAKLLGYTEE